MVSPQIGGSDMGGSMHFIWQIRFLIKLPVLLGLTMTFCQAAGSSLTPSGLDKQRVDMEIRSFWSVMPERGWVNLDIEIRNRMSQDAEWTFQFRANKHWSDEEYLETKTTVRVGANSVRTARVLVPVYPTMESGYSVDPRLEMSILGPGSALRDYNVLNSGSGHYAETSRFLLVSEGASGAWSEGNWDWPALEKEAEDVQAPFSFVHADLEVFPSDMKALLGADLFVMLEKEWRERPPSERKVINRWVLQGGHLVLVGEGGKEVRNMGQGTVRTFSSSNAGMKEVLNRLRSIKPVNLRVIGADSFHESEWELRKSFPDIHKPIGILMVVVIVVAAALGPVNLWLAFRRRNSLQMLWSTPMLSVGISALIGVAILVADGLGGQGVRAHWVLLLPQHQAEVSWQEQVSRTGLLPSGSFQLDEGWWIRPVSTGMNDDYQNRKYFINANGVHRGDWFANRRVQAQILQRVQTSRARVSVTRTGETPQVLSTVETPFARLLYRDAKGEVWLAEDVNPGEPVALARGDSEDERALLRDLRTRKAHLFPEERLLASREWFFAEGAEDGRMMETLPSVKWTDHAVWFLGPVAGGAHE